MLLAEAECDCTDAIEYVVVTGRATRCQLCGAPLEPTGGPRPVRLMPAPAVDELVRRATLPGPAPDARVSVVRDPRPSGARFVRPSFSDDAPARLLRLLEELQVDVGDDRAGGVSWAPPSDIAAQRYDRDVIQTSARPREPNLAALLGVVEDARPTVEATITVRAAGDVTVASVLRWLRAHGDRAELAKNPRPELTRTYAEVGYVYASEKTRAKWDADPRAKAEAAPVRGRELVTRAMECWWAR